MKKKILALVSSAVMTLSLTAMSISFVGMPDNAVKANATTVIPEGYTPIYTFEDLYAIRNDLTGNYILMNDIDMSEETAPGGDWDINGTGWEPIGRDSGDKAFCGKFDGNGHSIIGMDIHGKPQYRYIGLFGYVYHNYVNGKDYYPSITNLRMKDVNIDISANTSGYSYIIGTVAGCFWNDNSIYSNNNSESLSNCFSDGSINVNSCNNVTVGGITGKYYANINTDSMIPLNNCYNVSNINLQNVSSCVLGGIAGYSNVNVNNCYNVGKLTANQVKFCEKGAIIGDEYYQSYNQYNCYYINGCCEGQSSISGKCMGLSVGQMKSEAAFTNWDFDNTWIIDPTSSYKYPQLRSIMQVPVSKVEMLYLPDKTVYVQDEQFDLNGGFIGVHHSDGSYGEAAIKEKWVSNYDMNRIGKQTVVVKYADKTITFDINVKPKSISGLKTASTSTESVNLTWNKVNGVTGYIIYMYNSDIQTWEEIDRTVTNINSYTVTDLEPATKYTFAVKAYKELDETDLISTDYIKITSTTNPEKVDGFKVSGTTNNSVKLTWNKVSGANGYLVYKFNNTKQSWERVTRTNNTNTYTVQNLSAGTTYMFSVLAYKNVNGNDITSISYPTVTSSTNPAVVSGFKVSATTASAVKLTWNKTSGATGYFVYRYNSSTKKYVRIAKVNANTYTDKKLKAGMTYIYAVKAYKTINANEILSISYPKITTSTNPATVNFKLTAGSKKATVKWSKVTGASGYIVYYKISSNGSWKKLKTTTGTSFTKTGLIKGRTYYFTVRAYRNVNGKTYNGSFTTKSIRIK